MLIDSYGRVVDYFRISVTERCNFRCLYCMPEKPFSWVPKENLLSFEDLFLFVKVGIDEGVKKIRITGGEPLLRKDLSKFIQMISSYKSDIDLALTTNAYFLSQVADELKNAGLKRVNISLDTLNREVAWKISQKDILPSVLKGIEEALKVGLKVKLNSVPLKNINEDEIIRLLQYAKGLGVSIRFIEYMENSFAKTNLVGLSSDEILSKIKTKYDVTKVQKDKFSPSELYKLKDGYTFGIIDPHRHDFCESCNRIRLSAEGMLIPCLYFDEAMSIKKYVQKGDIAGATAVLREVLRNKPEKNRWNPQKDETSSRAFYKTGG